MKFLQTLNTCVLALSSVVGAASFSNPLKKTDGSDPHRLLQLGSSHMEWKRESKSGEELVEERAVPDKRERELRAGS
jgi:hypothetical protein